MTWTEEAEQKMDAILAGLPQRMEPPARCKAVKEACPYSDPIKVRAWKVMAQSRINPTRSKKPVSKLPLTEEQQAWIAKNMR